MGGDEKQRKNEGILRFNCRDKWDSEIQVAEKSGRTETGGQSCRKKWDGFLLIVEINGRCNRYGV